MRRDVAVLALVGSGILILACQGRPPCPDGQVCMDPGAACPPGQVCMLPADQDVDGCTNPEWGAALVKAKIKLKKDNQTDRCVATVTPEHVCVMPGGAIRWQVKNHCDIPDNPEGVLKITGITWLECDPKLTALEMTPDVPADPEKPEPLSPKNQLFCGVPDDQDGREYKYAVEGPEFEGVDPWVEVRRGG